jgi:hypothetical protein
VSTGLGTVAETLALRWASAAFLAFRILEKIDICVVAEGESYESDGKRDNKKAVRGV